MTYTPDPDVVLPEGKTCADCKWFRRCSWLVSRKGPERECDWGPSRFVPLAVVRAPEVEHV